MVNKNIFITLFSLIFLIGLVSAVPSTSTNPDSYSCDAGVDDCSVIFDDNWSTDTFNPGGATGMVYMNYTKPDNVKSAIWDIKIGISASFAQQTGSCWDGSQWVVIFQDTIGHLGQSANRNYTLPQDCFNQNEIQLLVQMDSASGKFVHFYEEQIRWSTDSEELVSYQEMVNLPQLISSVPLDNAGPDRTLLFCTWQIDGQGEQAQQMTTQLCPNPQESFIFENDESYYTRIDAVDIFWNSTSGQWEAESYYLVDDAQIDYVLDIPEPTQGFIDSLIGNIISMIQSILCQLFPSLGFC